MFKDLNTCTHVFPCSGPNKKALERLNTWPHKIMVRVSEQVYNIEVNGSTQSVSAERLKPAYFVPEDLDLILTPRPLDQNSNASTNGEQRRALTTYSRKQISFVSVV